MSYVFISDYLFKSIDGSVETTYDVRNLEAELLNKDCTDERGLEINVLLNAFKELKEAIDPAGEEENNQTLIKG